jgi:DNA-binding beta-propeller fold protein YncE
MKSRYASLTASICLAGGMPTRSLGMFLMIFVIIFPVCAAVPLDAAAPVPVQNRIQAKIVKTLSASLDPPVHMPTDVAVDRRGRVFVADGVEHRILQFSAEGKLEGTLRSFGDHLLNRPVGLALDAQDRLWIADPGNRNLCVISAEGNLEQVIPVPTKVLKEVPNHPSEPTDVAVTPDGKRTYVVDNDNHRVLIRDNQNGEWISLGKRGRALGRFQWPFMICVGAEEYVYISEVIGARVQRITPRDRWSGQIGRWGIELGQLYRPKGVATDAKGRVYISDSTLGVIQVFGPWGNLQGVLTDSAGNILRFQHPMGLCFDPQGKLYVVEMTANRVAVVTLGNSLVSSKKKNNHDPKENRS